MEQAAHEKAQSPSMPIAIFNDVPELNNAAGKQIEHNHQSEADIEAPEASLDEFLSAVPNRIATNRTQTKEDDSEGQHAKDTEHGGVTVICSQAGAYLEIRHDR